MTEDYFLVCRVWAIVGWVVVLALMASAWVVAVTTDEWIYAGLLAAGACASSAVAATLHIRSFMVRVCSLIRAASANQSAVVESRGLHRIP